MSKVPPTMPYMKLGDTELIHREASQDNVTELRSIHNLTISGKRNIVELKIPGSSGNAFQDLGRDPITISIEGLLTGVDAKKTIETLKSKFDSGEPLPFSTNVSFLNGISKVIVLEMSFQLMDGMPQQIVYHMKIKEFPAEKKGTAGSKR